MRGKQDYAPAFARVRAPKCRSAARLLRTTRYVGAGPPEGTGRHRYIFAVLALEAEKVEIDKGATPAFLMFNLFEGTLGRALLTGWYER